MFVWSMRNLIQSLLKLLKWLRGLLPNRHRNIPNNNSSTHIPQDLDESNPTGKKDPSLNKTISEEKESCHPSSTARTSENNIESDAGSPSSSPSPEFSAPAPTPSEKLPDPDSSSTDSINSDTNSRVGYEQTTSNPPYEKDVEPSITEKEVLTEKPTSIIEKHQSPLSTTDALTQENKVEPDISPPSFSPSPEFSAPAPTPSEKLSNSDISSADSTNSDTDSRVDYEQSTSKPHYEKDDKPSITKVLTEKPTSIIEKHQSPLSTTDALTQENRVELDTSPPSFSPSPEFSAPAPTPSEKLSDSNTSSADSTNSDTDSRVDYEQSTSKPHYEKDDKPSITKVLTEKPTSIIEKHQSPLSTTDALTQENRVELDTSPPSFSPSPEFSAPAPTPSEKLSDSNTSSADSTNSDTDSRVDYEQSTSKPHYEKDDRSNIAKMSDANEIQKHPNGSKSKQTDQHNLSTKPPKKIAGRRGKQTAHIRSFPQQHRTPKPELICRRHSESSTWQVVVVTQDGIKSVRQGGHELTVEKGLCVIHSFTEVLSFFYGDKYSTDLEIFGNQSVAIFKFATNWTGKGHKVERITHGHYIVIAPRDFSQIGYIPCEKEPCNDTRYLAFFFYIEESSDHPIGFAQHKFRVEAKKFQFDYTPLFDCSDMGPLFVGTVPKLVTSSEIKWVRIGEEREDGWRGENFQPHENSLEHVLNGRQGRFFLRMYDDYSKMVDSGEFRYIQNLSEIRVNGDIFTRSQIILPNQCGHKPSTISFINRNNAEIQPSLVKESPYVSFFDNTIVVAPNAKGDRISCLLPTEDTPVEVTVVLPRVWWRIESCDESSDNWQDKPVVVSRSRFQQLAKSSATICLKLPRYIKYIKVGLNGKADRRYPKKVSDQLARIPLIDFVYYQQIKSCPYDQVMLNASLAEGKAVNLLKITANPLPTILSFESDPTEILEGEMATIRWTTHNTVPGSIIIEPEIGHVEPNGSRDVSPRSSTSYTLRIDVLGKDNITSNTSILLKSHVHQSQLVPRVKNSRGLRQGKGFSLGEIKLHNKGGLNWI